MFDVETISYGINVNKFLDKLSLKQALEKLAFDMIEVNGTTLANVQKFVKISDLTLLCSSNLPFQLDSNTAWPPNLQRLHLQHADVSVTGFLSTIQSSCTNFICRVVVQIIATKFFSTTQTD